MEDIRKGSEYLPITEEIFIKQYLCQDSANGIFKTVHTPCDFLQENGDCLLGDCKPDDCAKYPYTDQAERLYSLFSVLEAVEVCPVVFEIYERLKKEYGFKPHVTMKRIF